MNPRTPFPVCAGEVATFLKLLYEPGDTFEVRAPKCLERPGSSYAATASGYFTGRSSDAAARAIAALDERGLAPGIYVTLNPTRPALLARAANQVKWKATATTGDADIVRRRALLIDADPTRPAGISATDEELESARLRIMAVRDHLTAQGWPAPVVSLSGNGYHAIYRIDLPGDDGGLVKDVLNALADRFDDDSVTIDKGVFNAARIVKIPGTMARKGDDLQGVDGVEDRPHRRSVLADAPDEIQVVTREQLQAVAKTPDTQPSAMVPTPSDPGGFPKTAEGLRAWLEARGVEVKGQRRNGAGTLLLLERCPVSPEIVSTGSSDIAVLVEDSGRISYCNKHNRGAGYGWSDLRASIDPEYAARPTENGKVDVSGIMDQLSTPRGVGVNGTETHPSPPQAVILNMEEVESRPVEWLWPGRIPLGKLTLCVGDGGCGKSTLTTDIAARVSSGTPWPDESESREPAGVVILSAEDDPSDTVKPRLDAHGADCARVKMLTAISNPDGSERCVTLGDLDALEEAIDATPGCRLVIVDPVSAYSIKGLDSHNNSDVRTMLAPLADLAARRGVAVVSVSHLSKGGAVGTKALYRVMGSVGWGAAVRAAWGITVDPDDPAESQADKRRLMLPLKMNCGKPAEGWTYTIVEGNGVGAVAWQGEAAGVDVDQAMGGEAAPTEREAPARSEAEGWLLEILGGKAEGMLVKELKELAKHGFSWRTLERARHRLGIQSERRGNFEEGGWWWFMPGAAIGGPEGEGPEE